jgi:hypothetical protein
MTSSPWLPRLFAAAMIPSIIMILAMLFYPDMGKCPWMAPTGSVGTEGPYFSINGSRLHVNNSRVLTTLPSDGLYLILLGSVFDVRSAEMHYGPDGGYHALANGFDATKMLIASDLSLGADDDDLDSVAAGKQKESLVQWIPFFFHKYPQIGVMNGRYFDKSGQPTKFWNQINELVETGGIAPRDPKRSLEPCVSPSSSSVGCTHPEHVPKMIRRHGKSSCACIEEVFNSPDFVVVHFEKCENDEKICFPNKSEL